MGDVELEDETYAPVSVGQLARQRLAGELAAQLRSGRQTLQGLGLPLMRREFVATTSLGSSGLQLLGDNGVQRLLVPSGSVAPVPPTWVFPVWAPFRVRHSHVEVDASDYYLERHLESGSDAALRANQLFADLAVLYFSLQPQANRGVTLLAPPSWRPSNAFLATLLPALATSRIIKNVVLSHFFDQVPPGSAEPPLLYRRLAPMPTSGDRLPVTYLHSARRQLGALASLVPSLRMGLKRLGNLVLVGESARLSRRARLGFFSLPSAELSRLAAKVKLPRDRTITVTSLRARVPIAVFSTSRLPLHAELHLHSLALGFRRSTVPVVLHGRNNVIEVQVSARTVGDFPIELRLTTPSGHFQLSSGNLLIRSTAISSVALGLTAGAAAFLVLWWARSAFKRRRSQPSGRRRATGGGQGSPSTGTLVT
jgi:hypothetical protein